jgi:hypothetical protein
MAKSIAETRAPSAGNIVRLQDARRGETHGGKRHD